MYEQDLNTLQLSKDVSYKIMPKAKYNLREAYYNTFQSLKILKIEEINEILVIIATVLNLGNVEFVVSSDICDLTPGNVKNLVNPLLILVKNVLIRS